MRRASKIDANHRDVQALFEAHGCTVASTAMVGHGFPDFLVCAHRLGSPRIALVEVKHGTGKLRPAQEAFREKFPVWIVRSDADVCEVVTWLKN